jgi:hypothetical protein
MSGVNKEAPVVEDTTPKPESTSSTASPAQVDAATPLEAVKDAAASAVNTVSDKATKIFGSFTAATPTDSSDKSDTPKESTPSKPLFGGFASSGSSAWAAPTTAGGFGATSSFTPKKDTKETEDKVFPPYLHH